jgi:hypothetical protein
LSLESGNNFKPGFNSDLIGWPRISSGKIRFLRENPGLNCSL